MDQERIGKLIKEIRKKNNLTQKQLADKYGVTYQAVSKWENGKNIPDISLIKEMSKDFNVSLEELLNGEYSKRKRKIGISIICIFLVILGFFFLFFHDDKDFEFKTISSSCSNFTISGSLSYSNSKSAIYITNINYCGGVDNTEYQDIECILYENNNNIQTTISTYHYKNKKPITLEKFLKNVTFSVDNYSRICKNYSKDSLTLVIKANDGNKTTTYDIPLSIDKNCK